MAREYIKRYNICKKYNITPSQLNREYVDELEIYEEIENQYDIKNNQS